MNPRRATVDLMDWYTGRFAWPLTIEGEGDDGNAGGGGGNTDDAGSSGADTSGADAGAGKEGGEGIGLTAEISKPAGDGDGSEQDGVGDDAGKDGDSGADKESKPQALTFEKRPDWLPEQFHDQKSGEVKIEDLAKAWSGMRAKVSTGDHKAPKDAASYKLEIGDDFAGVVEAIPVLQADENGTEAPILEWFRGAAHEHQLSQDVAASLFTGYLEQIKATLPEPMDTKAELAKLGPKGQQILDGQATWLNGLKDKGIVNDDQHAELYLNLDTATGVSALVALRTYYEGYQIPAALTSEASVSDTADGLRAEMSKVMALADKGDLTAQRKHAELMKKYDALYGTEPAGSSARPAV